MELCAQSLDPWLDQIALPLVIHALGGGRDTLPEGLLDGEVSCHYRVLPLLYARETDRVVEVLEQVTAPNKIKKVLKGYDAIKRMIYQGRGQKVRALFDQGNLPRKEQAIRNKIKSAGFWVRLPFLAKNTPRGSGGVKPPAAGRKYHPKHMFANASSNRTHVLSRITTPHRLPENRPSLVRP